MDNIGGCRVLVNENVQLYSFAQEINVISFSPVLGKCQKQLLK